MLVQVEYALWGVVLEYNKVVQTEMPEETIKRMPVVMDARKCKRVRECMCM